MTPEAGIVERTRLFFSREEFERNDPLHDLVGELLSTIERQSRALAREALEFYANPEIYKPHPSGPAFDRRDLSHTARAALNAGGEGDGENG